MDGLEERRGALRTLVLVVLVVFAALGLGRFGFSMLLPSMQDAMGLTNAQSGQLQSWNSLGYLLAVAVAGVLATRYGPSVVITSAVGLLGLSMIANGVFTAFWASCAARFVSGAGGAAANVPAMGLLAAWFSARRRGLAAGCAVSGSSLGVAATGLLVPRILAEFPAIGWRLCWAAYGGVALLICVLCAIFLRDRPEDAPTAETEQSGSGARWIDVLHSRLLWQVSAAYFAFGFSYSIYATFFVRHLTHRHGMDAVSAGGVWTQVGLISIVSSFVWGLVSDRWGRRNALVTVFICQGTAFLLAGLGGDVLPIVGSGVLFALTAWSIPAVVAALCGDVFGGRLAPTALGIATVVFGMGQVLGPVAGGWLADASGSFGVAFTTAGVIALALGAGVSSRLPRQPSPTR